MKKRTSILRFEMKGSWIFPLSLLFWIGCAAGTPGSDPSPHMYDSEGSGKGRIEIAWDDVPDVDSYNIYISESPHARVNGKKIRGANNPTRIIHLENGVIYFIAVTSVRGGIESDSSEEMAFSVSE